MVLAIRPSVYRPLFSWFDVAPGNERRVLFVVILAVIVLFFLVVRVQSEGDTNERTIRLLVEALGRERFDWDRAAALHEAGGWWWSCRRSTRRATSGPWWRRCCGSRRSRVVPVVVSDGSMDATATEARAAGARHRVAGQPRGGLALRVGYEIALQLGAEIVVTMDADGQHLAEELPVMVAPILDGAADYVNGSRLLGDFERDSLTRHIGVHVFSRIVSLLTGRRITDPSSGYRAARADLLHRLVLEQDQFWTSEILIEALRHRARVVEVPVTIVARSSGTSKKPASLRYGWHFSRSSSDLAALTLRTVAAGLACARPRARVGTSSSRCFWC